MQLQTEPPPPALHLRVFFWVFASTLGKQFTRARNCAVGAMVYLPKEWFRYTSNASIAMGPVAVLNKSLTICTVRLVSRRCGHLS